MIYPGAVQSKKKKKKTNLTMSNPKAEQECIICAGMQESRTHTPNHSFAMELAPGTSWDAEEAKKKIESKWEL